MTSISPNLLPLDFLLLFYQVKEWPEEKYGTFFSGDSYIILHTEKASPDSDVSICFQITFLELLVSLYKLIGKIIIAAKMDTNDTNTSP